MSDWMAVKDPNTGRTYYANMTTRETRWDKPPGFAGSDVPAVSYTPSTANLMMEQGSQSSFASQSQMSGYGSQMSMSGYGSQASLYQSQSRLAPQGTATQASKWRKAHDDNTGRDYWYHADTKETTWTMPTELQSGSDTAKRLSAQMAMMGMAQSEMQLNTNAWESSEDDESGDDSWGKGGGGGDGKEESEEDSSSDDGLQTYQAKATVGPSLVNEEVSDSEEEEEKNMAAADMEDEVIVDEHSSKFWTIGETQGDQYRLDIYGDRYFQQHKKTMFKKYSVQELLEWMPYKKMTNAMKKMDSKMNSEARQTWKNINSYMGDRKTGKDSAGHVDKLLRYALKAPEELRDEIYCQLCKQTNKNPGQASLKKGWMLMAICCSVFPPSDEFACYLAAYLFNRTKEADFVGEFAAFALQALDRTMDVGQRRVQPVPLEVQRIEERQPIPLKVHFLDGTFHNLLVFSQTRALEVTKTVAATMKLNHAESFGLFEMEEPPPDFEERAYQKREALDRQGKIDDLQHMPYDRELELNERVLDVVASWQRSKRKQKRKIQLVFKCKLHSKAQENSYSRAGWRLAFQTAVWHVRHGYYPINEGPAFAAAALQLQAQHGIRDDAYYTQGIANDPTKYLPYKLAQQFGAAAEERVLQEHRQYKHLDKADAFRKYIELLRNDDFTSKFFGNHFFRCVRVSRLKRQTKKEQEDLLLGISENGVIFVHPRTQEIVERYKMEEILTYGFRSNAFLFVAGTLMTQKKYQFATMLGKQMNDLLRAHIDLRVQQAEIQGYNIMT